MFGRVFSASVSETAAGIVGLAIWFSPVVVFLVAIVYLRRNLLLARGLFRAALTLDAMLIFFAGAFAAHAAGNYIRSGSLTAGDWVFGCLFPVPLFIVLIASPILLRHIRRRLSSSSPHAANNQCA